MLCYEYSHFERFFCFMKKKPCKIMLISFFLPKFSYSKDFDIVTLQRFSELNLESETILNKSIMKELRIETLVEMAKESDPELVNVDWVEAMEGHYCYYDDSKGEGKSIRKTCLMV